MSSTIGDIASTLGKPFKVEINGQVLPVKSYSGGGLGTSKSESLPGNSLQNELTTGHNYISELTVVAYVTPNEKILTDAMNSVANQGKNERYTITITELAKDKSVIKTYVYDQCLITSLDYPSFDPQGGEILTYTATFKPTILTVK